MLPARSEVQKVGNYRLYELIGTGGMGSVHLGRLYATGGFRRFVAIKRLHPHLAANAEFVGAFLDEARLASRIHHPNVIAPLDVVAKGGEALLVFEYVDGISLAAAVTQVVKRGDSIPSRIIVSIMVDVLNGLQAAHEATGGDGEPLGLIHRDVSPQNVLVGREGTARLLDFGIAKAAGRSQNTDEGIVKGKRGYMAPEHLLGQSSRACDIYSAGVVLYELLLLRRLFPDDAALADRIAGAPVVWPAGEAANVDPLLRAAAEKALAPDPAARFGSAGEMSAALEAVGIASSREVSEWLQRVAGDALQKRAAVVARAEAASDSLEALAIPAAFDAAPVATSTEVMPRVVATPKRSTARYLAGAGAALLVVASVLILVGRTSASAPSREAAEPAPTSGAPTPSASAAAEPSAVDSSAASASAEPAAPSRATATASPARGPSKSRPAASARGACNPYVLDKDGRTHFNEACLRRSAPAGR